jgi:hypothetical protein
LDWFRFHGKKYIINLLHNEGFYDVKISRKMDLLGSCSFIKIEGVYISTLEGAVYGAIRIYDDQIEAYDNIASLTMEKVVQTNVHPYYVNQQSKKQKELFIYMKHKI